MAVQTARRGSASFDAAARASRRRDSLAAYIATFHGKRPSRRRDPQISVSWAPCAGGRRLFARADNFIFMVKTHCSTGTVIQVD